MGFEPQTNNHEQCYQTTRPAKDELLDTQGNYATVGSAIVAIAIVGRGGWADFSSTVAI